MKHRSKRAHSQAEDPQFKDGWKQFEQLFLSNDPPKCKIVSLHSSNKRNNISKVYMQINPSCEV